MVFSQLYKIIYPFVAAVVLCISCSPSIIFNNTPEESIGWNMFGGDPYHSNSTQFDLRPPLRLKKKIKTSSTTGVSPVVSQGVIYAQSLDGKIETFNLLTGMKRGKIKVETGIIAALVISGKRMYYAKSKGKETFFCYNVFRGQHIWRKELGAIEASPVLYENKFFIGTLDGRLYCLEKEEGEIIWQSRVDDSIYTSPAVWEDIVTIGTVDGTMYAFRTGSGEKIWEKELSGGIIASGSIARGIIFIGTTDNTFYALDAENGEIKWEFKTNGKIYSTPAVKDFTVIFGCNDKFLYALNQADGRLIWKYDAKGLINTSPVIAGKTVYFGSLNHNLYGLNLDTGEEKWKYKTNGKIVSSPVIYKDNLIAATQERRIFVFEEQAAQPLFNK